MAPLEPNVVGRSNTLPLAVFSGQILAVAGLTVHVLQTIRRAARTLPPSRATRAQRSTRSRNVGIFATLGLLSLATVTTFAVAWRALSYFEWAEKGAHESPGTIWTGWYGTGEEGVGRWRLGDWWSDVDMIEETDARILAAPEAFLYLYQHFCGITAAAIFFGVEGRRRNIPIKTIAAFVALSNIGSLGLALNLFFILLLFTPMAVHDDDSVRHDALFAPKPWVLYVPVIGAILLEQSLPLLLARRTDLTLFRLAYIAVPLFLAFAPELVPTRFGHKHSTKADAHRAYVKAFYVLGLTSLALHWKQLATTLLVNTPPPPSYYDLMKNLVTKNEKPNRLMAGLSNTGQKLKLVSGHPAISVTGTDVAFTALSLLAWTFIRQLDVNDILDNSILSFLNPKEKEEKPEAFNPWKPEPDETVTKVVEVHNPPITPRKRGRPRKNAPKIDPTPAEAATTVTPREAAAVAALRRSSRRKTADTASDHYDGSDADDSTYEPPEETASELQQTEMDAVMGSDDLVAGGEGTAVGLVLTLLGGLGQLAAGVLGAEVTGST